VAVAATLAMRSSLALAAFALVSAASTWAV